MATEVTDGVIQQRLAHSKVVYLPEVGLLVDTGPASEWNGLVEFLESHGVPDAVFLSHAHGDHIGNAERVFDEYDPDVFVPANEQFDDVDMEEANVTEVEDGDEVTDGVAIVEVPGHTSGICALHLPDRGVLLGTDVLDGSDRRGLPPGFLLPPPGEYNWDSQAAETNLAKLLDLEFDTVVVTHGTNVEENPRLKLDRYLNFADHYRQELLEELA